MNRTLIKIAWLAVLLGLVMELLTLALGAVVGARTSGAQALADVVQKVSWSFVACVGLALGALASKAPVPAMGFAGLIAAPVAFTVARALHKGAAQALALAPAGAAAPAMALAGVKAVEYACLGALLAAANRRGAASAGRHATIGLLTGLVFGGTAVAMMPLQPWPAVLARALNELVFPVGCSMVLFTARILQPRLSPAFSKDRAAEVAVRSA